MKSTLRQFAAIALAGFVFVEFGRAQTPPTITTNPTNQAIGAVFGVAGGGSHSVACRTDGALFAWGSNSNGQIGDRTTTSHLTAVPILIPNGTAAFVAAGNKHSLLLTNNGITWVWGANAYGQLGNGSTTDSSSLVSVGALGNAVAGACGFGHTVVVRQGGTVFACGWNGNGQLGDGTTTNRTTPISVSGLSSAVKVTAGYCHTVALKSDGTVCAWGGNVNGQLGDGTTTQRLMPVPVSGLNNIVTVVAGWYHTVALKRDGTVWVWGSNTGGQLGDGTTTQRNTPIQVPNLTGIVGVAAGADFTVAVKSDGTVWAWGNNSVGQLGDGTTTTRLAPVQVSGISNAIAVGAGAANGFALQADYSVVAWGNDADGELGDGATTSKTSPVRTSSVNQAVFSLFATGAPNPTYQWFRKPAGQATFTSLANDNNFSGVATASLTVLNPSAAMFGDQYACILSNSAGTFTTAGVTLLAPGPIAGKVSFTNPGQTQWTVPPGITQVQFKIWGAGGLGYTPNIRPYFGSGGSGGYVTAMYSVIPGQVINVGVGQTGGNSVIPSASAAWVPAGFQLIAGGGGSGGWADGSAGCSGGTGGAGGPNAESGSGDGGGYTSGGGGATGISFGGGGQNSSGDIYQSGSGPVELVGDFGALNSGGGSGGPDGGGCGYYGGGAGGSDAADGGGGGGSNHLDVGNGYIAGSGASLGGSGSTPPATNDPDYPAAVQGYVNGYTGYGMGGAPYTPGGAIIIKYNAAPQAQTISIAPSFVSMQTGASCTVTGVGGSSAGSWQWSFPANCVVSNATIASPTITPLVPGTYTITGHKEGDVNYQPSNTASVTIIASGPTVMTAPGTYSVMVPAGISVVRIRIWGAGGTGDDGSTSHVFAKGGGGGFAEAAYNVSAGTLLNLVVGPGGGVYQSGGGGSAAYVLNGFQVIAGAGGGGSDRLLSSQPSGGAGGAGGPSGQSGHQPFTASMAWGGDGATVTGPGAGGAGNYTGHGGGGPVNLAGGMSPVYLRVAGSCWPWGDGGNYGSGGGGYYGGGGGGYDSNYSVSAGGGGGSNYIDTAPSHGYIVNTVVSLGGDGSTPANTSDPYYTSGVAVGRDSGHGGNGCVVVEWNPILTASTGSAPPDTTPPTAPPWLNYANAGATNITLTWGAATDNVGVVAYLVYRGTQFLGSTPDLTFTDSNLAASTAYSYTVKAQDAAGNLSAASPVLNVSTTQDFSADSDHDGIPDVTESALGTNANSAASADTTNQTQQNIHRPTQ